MARKHTARASQSRQEQQGAGTALASRPESGTMREMVEKMERFFQNPWDFLSGSWTQSFEPKIDMEQTAKEIVVTAKLPGYGRDDVSVDLTEDSITVRGYKSSSRESKKEGSYREEQSFVRSLWLPDEILAEQAKASFKGDTLEIRLPRAKEARVRKLEVQ